jgi:hypothetical protein
MAILVAGIIGVATATPALATPPANDTESGAIVVRGLPFVHSMDSSEANGDGPRFCANSGSVFYRFTPVSGVRMQVDTIGSRFDTVLSVYTRDAAGEAQRLGCSDDRFGSTSGLRLRAQAGVTYFIMVGRCCGDGGDGGGPLTLTISEVADVELHVTSELSLPTTVDPSTGLATVSGRVTCNERSVVYPNGMLRQLRDDLWLARGWYWLAIGCMPGEPVSWSVEIDSESMIAFGAGPALIRSWDAASDGFEDWVQLDRVDHQIQLASA